MGTEKIVLKTNLTPKSNSNELDLGSSAQPWKKLYTQQMELTTADSSILATSLNKDICSVRNGKILFNGYELNASVMTGTTDNIAVYNGSQLTSSNAIKINQIYHFQGNGKDYTTTAFNGNVSGINHLFLTGCVCSTNVHTASSAAGHLTQFQASTANQVYLYRFWTSNDQKPFPNKILSVLTLGNNVASETLDNSSGCLQLYNAKGKYVDIYVHQDVSGDKVQYLPGIAGLHMIGVNKSGKYYGTSAPSGSADEGAVYLQIV